MCIRDRPGGWRCSQAGKISRSGVALSRGAIVGIGAAGASGQDVGWPRPAWQRITGTVHGRGVDLDPGREFSLHALWTYCGPVHWSGDAGAVSTEGVDALVFAGCGKRGRCFAHRRGGSLAVRCFSRSSYWWFSGVLRTAFVSPAELTVCIWASTIPFWLNNSWWGGNASWC